MLSEKKRQSPLSRILDTLSSSLSFERSDKTILLFYVLPLCLLALGLYNYKPQPFFAVDVSKMQRGDIKLAFYRDESYLVLRLNKGSEEDFRVFSAEAKHKIVLLTHKDKSLYRVACQRFHFRPRDPQFDKATLRCNEPAQWKRNSYVYDIDGKSLSKKAADLYRPIFEQAGQEIRIRL